MVKIVIQTDFASKTDEIKAFVDDVAKYAYGYQYSAWENFIEASPKDEISNTLVNKLNNLIKEYKENIYIDTIILQ